MKALAKKFAQIFFGVESAEEMKKKGLLLSLAIPAVRWFDWAMVGMTAALVVFLKSQEFAGWKIFVLLWGGNIILSAATISLNDKVKIDLTLAEGLRRLINAAIEKSRLSGLVLEGLLMFRLLLWDGPCAFVIFLRERIKPETEIMVLIIASGIQMAVWTVIYSLGYEGILGAIKALF